ncbi:MAG: hypothetical protein K2X01_01975 [Cyanobacteria bacterium]|nr:hypothetical protein [Cyanobacteriota bacterium]
MPQLPPMSFFPQPVSPQALSPLFGSKRNNRRHDGYRGPGKAVPTPRDIELRTAKLATLEKADGASRKPDPNLAEAVKLFESASQRVRSNCGFNNSNWEDYSSWIADECTTAITAAEKTSNKRLQSAAYLTRGIAYGVATRWAKTIHIHYGQPASEAGRADAYPKAVADFEKAYALDPQNRLALLNLAILHRLNGEAYKSSQALVKLGAVTGDPRWVEYHNNGFKQFDYESFSDAMETGQYRILESDCRRSPVVKTLFPLPGKLDSFWQMNIFWGIPHPI